MKRTLKVKANTNYTAIDVRVDFHASQLTTNELNEFKKKFYKSLYRTLMECDANPFTVKVAS